MANHHQVSKFLSLLLRHRPEILGLSIDKEGFCNVSLTELVALMNQQPKFSELKVQDILTVVAEDTKGRYQVVGDKIRALYGHSLPVTLLEKDTLSLDEVPEILYHGTAKENIDSIFSAGLLSGQRIYVHLSDNPSTALLIGKRHTRNPIIITINSKKLVFDGQIVKKVGKETYITNTISPKYLTVVNNN